MSAADCILFIVHSEVSSRFVILYALWAQNWNKIILPKVSYFEIQIKLISDETAWHYALNLYNDGVLYKVQVTFDLVIYYIY